MEGTGWESIFRLEGNILREGEGGMVEGRGEGWKGAGWKGEGSWVERWEAAGWKVERQQGKSMEGSRGEGRGSRIEGRGEAG